MSFKPFLENCTARLAGVNKVRFLLLLMMFICTNIVAQRRPAYDSAYYIHYPQDFVGRVYFSEKYSQLNIKDLNDGKRFTYHPNTKLSLGVGFTYRPLTINIGYGFGFLNTDKLKGKTKSIDVKSHIYSKKWVLDLYAQFYNSFYAYPKEVSMSLGEAYYVRPDLKLVIGGASAYRVLNNRRFSYRSTFIQDSWQKKSAGSAMVGLATFYTSFHGDSSFFPAARNHSPNARAINSVKIMQLGPGIGYAYHLVLPLNLYLMASANASVQLNLVAESGGSGSTNQLTVNPSLLYRAGAGYTNGIWNLSATWFNQQLVAKGAPSANKYVVNTGNLRVTLAKRFQPGTKSKRLLKPISWLNASAGD